MFEKAPTLVVVHSGSRSPRVAEYIHRMPDGRKVSTHFSWHGGKGLFVQQVPLTRQAWHVGGSRFLDDPRRPNIYSYGIELPGPWRGERDDRQRRFLRALLRQLRCFCGPSPFLTGHEMIDPRKRDPGPGVTASWFQGLGYRVVWEWCRGVPIHELDVADGTDTTPPTP